MPANTEDLLRMSTLIDILNDARSKYYSYTDVESPLADFEYDRYLEELQKLEEKTGIVLKGSPTLEVGYFDVENDKIEHFKPVLSLKYTKDISELLSFLGTQEGILSWKYDGVSIILEYAKGRLVRGLTRGDGHYGKDITKNVLLMNGVPPKIPFTQRLIVRGEGCIDLRAFDILKRTKEGEKYRNPRNMASGLITAPKTSNILLKKLDFIVHSVIFLEGQKDYDLKTRSELLEFIKIFGFRIMQYQKVLNFELRHAIEEYTKQASYFCYPVDGLVLTINDIAYGDSLGSTKKYPRYSMAFKWSDETFQTRVTGMKWNVAKSGLITPVVQFEPIDIGGTEVRQANLHTLKKFESLQIGIGDTLRIFKANQIIPEVDDNLTRSGTEKYPDRCPVCGEPTTIVETPLTRKIYCYNCRK